MWLVIGRRLVHLLSSTCCNFCYKRCYCDYYYSLYACFVVVADRRLHLVSERSVAGEVVGFVSVILLGALRLLEEAALFFLLVLFNLVLLFCGPLPRTLPRTPGCHCRCDSCGGPVRVECEEEEDEGRTGRMFRPSSLVYRSCRRLTGPALCSETRSPHIGSGLCVRHQFSDRPAGWPAAPGAARGPASPDTSARRPGRTRPPR